jgi:hypothetical protein
MAKEEFQSNWRGARKYQFDEETRRKQAALERKFPDDELPQLAKPTEPIPNTEPAAPPPEPRPRRRRLLIAMMLLFATVASIAGYLTLSLYVPPPKAQRQTSAPNPSLPSKVLLPPARPRG